MVKLTVIDANIGAAVRRQREAAGYSVEGLADAIGASASQLQAYEDGSARISATDLLYVSLALGVAVSLLFDENSSKPNAIEHIAAHAADLPPERREGLLRFIRGLSGVR